MKKLSIGTLFIGTLLLLASCIQELVQPTGADGETVSVRLNITTAPMQAVGAPLTRATTDKTGDELAVHQAWVLQFDGNTAASRLLKAEEVTFTDNALETELLHTDATCRVYVVANSDCTPLAADAAAGNGINLADFEASLSAFAPTRTIDASTGLPMCAYQDFNPRTDAPATAFTLKPLVAKLTFRLNINPDFTGFTVSAITLKQVASGATFKESGAGNEAVRPSGATYTGELDLAGAAAAAVTCYLPENLSGRSTALKSMWQRGKIDAPESATYVEITGTTADGYSYAYSFFLGDGTPQDFNVARNYNYNLTATLNGTSEADLRTELVPINLNAGGKTANCYLVRNDNVKYFFNATVMGNGATTPVNGANTALITPTALSPASAVVLWEQSDPTGASNAAGNVVKNVSFSNGYIHFTTGNEPGNAVIAALDGSNNIIWSWHIWRPETNPGDVECSTPKNGGRDFKMMALNLGALNNEVNDVKALGLLYQWGRKDPFPGATGIGANDGGSATFNGVVTENGFSFSATDISAATITVANAVAAPMSFYSNGSRSDWVSVQQDNLWGNPFPSGSVPNPSLGSKSIYDPCPAGYRVAPQDTWGQNGAASDWTTNGQNLKVGKNGAKYFYPAAGLRWGDSDMGSLANVGSNGRYWSSSPYSNGDAYGGYLNFNNGNVNLELNSYRAYGMSVRCVQGE